MQTRVHALMTFLADRLDGFFLHPKDYLPAPSAASAPAGGEPPDASAAAATPAAAAAEPPAALTA